jgi:hypothetical protein
MRVWKEPNRQGGFYVCTKIGKRENRSFFSAPSNDIDHADLGYISNRFPIVNTEKRAEDFKRLYKNSWIKVSKYQKELMEHCIGISWKKKKPYRNYFFTNFMDKDWNELVKKGLADKSMESPNNDGNIYFWLTRQGVEYLLDRSITEKYYKEL